MLSAFHALLRSFWSFWLNKRVKIFERKNATVALWRMVIGKTGKDKGDLSPAHLTPTGPRSGTKLNLETTDESRTRMQVSPSPWTNPDVILTSTFDLLLGPRLSFRILCTRHRFCHDKQKSRLSVNFSPTELALPADVPRGRPEGTVQLDMASALMASFRDLICWRSTRAVRLRRTPRNRCERCTWYTSHEWLGASNLRFLSGSRENWRKGRKGRYFRVERTLRLGNLLLAVVIDCIDWLIGSGDWMIGYVDVGRNKSSQ